MNVTTDFRAATNPLSRACALVGVIGALSVWNPAHANEEHPLHFPNSQSTTCVYEGSIDAAASLMAAKAPLTGEPDIGAATPTAAASFGTLSAAQKANAQRVATALSEVASANKQAKPPVLLNTQALDSLDTTPATPTVVLDTTTTSAPALTPESAGLTINIALPKSVLQLDEAGNVQNITINLSFPQN